VRNQAEESFSALIAAAGAGDRAALGVLWRTYQPRLRGYLAGLDPRNAEDICSETWMAVGRSLERFQGSESEFRSWLFTIAHRRLIDQHRRDRRRDESPIDDLVRRPALLALPADAPDSPEEAVLRQEGAGEALALIGRLPEDQARAVLLRVIGGLTPTEAGAVLGKRPGAVRVLTHRGLRNLATMLGARQAFAFPVEEDGTDAVVGAAETKSDDPVTHREARAIAAL
jgi:RNA polymerase sigma-70 factor (ECF subfamily)